MFSNKRKENEAKEYVTHPDPESPLGLRIELC